MRTAPHIVTFCMNWSLAFTETLFEESYSDEIWKSQPFFIDLMFDISLIKLETSKI